MTDAPDVVDPLTGEVHSPDSIAYQNQMGAARQRRRGRAALAVGFLVAVGLTGITALAWVVWSHTGPVEEQGDVKTRPGTAIYEPPGRANLPPHVAEAARQANQQELKEAQVKDQAFTPSVVLDHSKPLQAPPVGVGDFGVQAGEQPRPAAAFSYSPPARPPDPAALDRLRSTIKATLEKGTTARGGMVEVQPDPDGFGRALGYDTRNPIAGGVGGTGVTSWNLPAPSGSGGGGGTGRDVLSGGVDRGGRAGIESRGGELLATPHRAFGMTEVALDSDAPSAVIVDVVSGPLRGGRVFGSFTSAYDSQAVKFDRLSFNGRDMAIEAIAVDLDQLTPALPAETDERYFDRVILPAATGFLAAAANSLSQPSQTTIVTSGVATQSSPERTVRQDLGAGVSGAANAANTVLNAQASATKRRVWIPALQPIGIWFIRNVGG